MKIPFPLPSLHISTYSFSHISILLLSASLRSSLSIIPPLTFPNNFPFLLLIATRFVLKWKKREKNYSHSQFIRDHHRYSNNTARIVCFVIDFYYFFRDYSAIFSNHKFSLFSFQPIATRHSFPDQCVSYELSNCHALLDFNNSS